MAGPNDQATLIIVLEAQAQKLQNQLVAVTGQIDRFAAQTERRFAQMNAANAASFEKLGTQVKGSLGGITSALGALGLSLGVKQIIDYANTWQTLQNKLASAASYSGLMLESLDDLTTSAIKARTPLQDYATLYARIATASGPLHLTQLQVAETTDLVSKAFKIGGATAAQQAGGIIQLTEAMETGFVQGRQLRSLATDAPVIAQALATYMKTTVGGLKLLGAQGKLTSEDLINAILAYHQKIDTAFASTQATIGDAIHNIESAFTAFVGTEGESSGAIKKLVDSLQYLATNFKTIAPIVLDFVGILAGAFAARAFVGFAGAIGEASVALATFLGSIAAGEITLAGLAAAMGPLALVIGGAAAAFVILANETDTVWASIDTLNGTIQTNADKLKIAQHASAAYRADLVQTIGATLVAAKANLALADSQLTGAKNATSNMNDIARMGTAAWQVLTGGANVTEFGGSADVAPRSALVDPAQAKRDAAAKQVEELQSQYNLSTWQQYLPTGTADQATGGGDEPPAGAGGKTGKGNAYERAVASIQKQTDALTAQKTAQASLNPAVDDYGFAIDKAKASSELLSAAEAAHIKITPTLKKAIDDRATAYAAADSASKKLAEQQKDLTAKTQAWEDTVKGATSTFIDDLVQGKSAADALGDALTQIGNQLLQMGLDQLFGGGTFGNKDQPFGLIGSLFMHANGGIASHGRPLPLFANGGVAKSASVFAEAGPEAAVPLPDGRRIPVDLRMPSAAAGSGAVHVTLNVPINAAGADPAAVSRLQTAVAEMKAGLPATIVKTVRAAKYKQRTL